MGSTHVLPGGIGSTVGRDATATEGGSNGLKHRGVYMGVEPKIGGKTPKWMVKIMENPIFQWMIWGKTHHLRKHPYREKNIKKQRLGKKKQE